MTARREQPPLRAERDRATTTLREPNRLARPPRRRRARRRAQSLTRRREPARREPRLLKPRRQPAPQPLRARPLPLRNNPCSVCAQKKAQTFGPFLCPPHACALLLDCVRYL